MTATVSLAAWAWVLVWIGAVALIAVGWALHGAVLHATGETIDLSVAAARGELDLDWNDPRTDWDDDPGPTVSAKPAYPPADPSC